MKELNLVYKNTEKFNNFYVSLLDKISMWREQIVSTNFTKNSLYIYLKKNKYLIILSNTKKGTEKHTENK